MLTITTNEFQTPLLWRHQPLGQKFPTGTFDSAGEEMKSLLVENSNKAAIIFIDCLGYARMGAASTIIRAAGTPTRVATNLNNTEFVPALMPAEILQMHVGVAKGRKVPKGAVRGAPLTTALLDGQTEWTGTNVHLYLSANCCIVPGGDGTKPWLEGMASDPQVQQAFGVHYGKDVEDFIAAVVTCMEQTQVIGNIFNKVTTANALDTHLGPSHGTFTIFQGAPVVDVVPITTTSHPMEVERLKVLCGPYTTIDQQPAATTTTTTNGAGFDAEKFDAALASKEREKMKTGHEKLMAIYVAAVTAKEYNGELTSVILPEATAGARIKG